MLVTVVAVKEPDLNATNPYTNRTFTTKEFVDYARDGLGVNIIFWSLSSKWLSHK